MRLSDIYDKRFRESKNASVFYNGGMLGNNYELLNEVNPPTREEIANFQLEQVKNMYIVSQETRDLVKKLNLDRMQPIYDTSGESQEAAIQAIEHTLGTWKTGAGTVDKNTISKDVQAGIEVDLQKYYNMASELTILHEKLSIYNSSAFISEKLSKIGTAIRQIWADMQNYKSGNFVIHDIDPNQGYIQNAIVLGNDLKGKYLEIVGTNFFAEHVPQGITVVDTSHIFGPTFDLISGKTRSEYKELRTDITAFSDSILKSIKIKYYIKNKGGRDTTVTESAYDFVQKYKNVNANSIVKIPSEEYNKLEQAIVFGAQAKSGEHQSIFNKIDRALSINDIVGFTGPLQTAKLEIYGTALWLLTQLKSEGAHIIEVSKEYYEPFFNYILGRFANLIIGRTNDLVVTRYGVQTLYEYMKSEWIRAKRIIAAGSSVNIKLPDKKTEIRYIGQK